MRRDGTPATSHCTAVITFVFLRLLSLFFQYLFNWSRGGGNTFVTALEHGPSPESPTLFFCAIILAFNLYYGDAHFPKSCPQSSVATLSPLPAAWAVKNIDTGND